jgi:sugar (pentulose or hexulose) kinase
MIRKQSKMFFCGIDIGTTNTKGVLLDQEGDLLSRISIPNPKDSAGVFWYTQFCKIMNGLSHDPAFKTHDVYCSITSQGGSFVLTDEKFRPVSSMHLWTDHQIGQTHANNYLQEHGQDTFYRLTGWHVSGIRPIFKLKGIDKLSYSRVAFVPDFIYSQLTGQLVTDITSAQMSGLYDFENKCWNKELIEWSGVDRMRLPGVCTSMQVIFPNVKTPWGRLNLVTSSHDQYAAMNAVELKVDKDIMLGCGTAWVVNSRRSWPIYDMGKATLHPGRDIATEHYGNISVIGIGLGKGFQDMLGSLGVDYLQMEKMETELRSISLFERSFPNSDDDGRTQKSLVIKYYMEWMAAMVRHHLSQYGLMDGLNEIILTGGAAGSRVLPQILADMCGIKVKAIIFPELTAYGAARHAAQAAGIRFEKRIGDIAESKIYYPGNRPLYKQWIELQMSHHRLGTLYEKSK